MVADPGREWALKTFGQDGVLIREQIPKIIQECHENMADSQAAAEMPHAGPYGYIWRKCLYEFSRVLGKLPTAEVISVPGYKLVSFNGVVLFPWRYAKEGKIDVESRQFAVSGTRLSLFTQPHGDPDSLLPIEFGHPELTVEDRDYLDEAAKTLSDAFGGNPYVVVVPYASNPSALHSIGWGEAALGADGYLTFEKFETLLDLGRSSLAEVGSADEAFSDGPIPRPQLGVKQDNETGESHA